MRAALVLLAAVVLAGCDEAALAKFDAYSDWAIQRAARKTIAAQALPVGDPKRLQLETEIEIEQQTFESIALRTLIEGIEIDTPEYVVQARRTNSGSFRTVIIITEKTPEAIPLPGPAAPATTRPGSVTDAQ